MAIIKRLEKGSALTHAEMDGNFTEIEEAIASLIARVDVLEFEMPTEWYDSYGNTVVTYNEANVGHELMFNDYGYFTIDGLNIVDEYNTIMFVFSEDYSDISDSYGNVYASTNYEA